MINKTILIDSKNEAWIDSENEAWIRCINRLIPNLQVGQTIILKGSKKLCHAQTSFRIDGIETTIGIDTDTIVQHIMVTPLYE